MRESEINAPSLERRRVQRIGWRSTWLGCFVWGRLWYLIAYSDTMQTRFFLALTASLWVLALMLPGDSFTRATFAYMAAITGSHAEAKWTAAFAIYAMAAFWRVFSGASGAAFAVITNALGVVLYSSIAFSVAVIPGVPFPAGAAAHGSIALAAIWVAVRTHVNSPAGWRHD